MDVEIERSLARWDHLARLDTSWMCWLELTTTLPPWFLAPRWWWPGSDLDLAAGRTAMSTNQPGPPVFVDRAGGQARPGLGKMRTTHPAGPRRPWLAAGWLDGPHRSWLAVLAGWTGSWTAPLARDGHEEGRRRLVGRLFLSQVESRLGEPDNARSGP